MVPILFYIIITAFCFNGFFNTCVNAIEGPNMYCGKRDCYDILQLSQSTNTAQIKKQYRKLSLQYHPDKNKDPNANGIFNEIARAYEILSNDKKRSAYDYYLAHPKDYAYNYGMYYTTVYAPKTDYRLVILGLVLFLSFFQYLSQNHRYNQAVAYFRTSDKVKRKAAIIQSEREASRSKNKQVKRMKDKKRNKERTKQELEDIIDELMGSLHISGGYQKPRIWDLLVVRIVILPYSLFTYFCWQLSWIVRFKLLKEEYGEEEMVYLTCKKLNITKEFFQSEEFDDLRDEIMQRKIWIGENYEIFLKYQEEEFKARHPDRYKRYIRNRKGVNMTSGEDDYSDG